MKTITLPAGTEYVRFGELAHLMAFALWPLRYDDTPGDGLNSAFASVTLERELAQAVEANGIPLNDPLTFGPYMRRPGGTRLEDALVRVDDLRKYVADRGLLVDVPKSETLALEASAPKVDAMKSSMDAKPWLSIDPKDPIPTQSWYTPARYFARQLVIADSTLLTKRLLLAEKVSKSLAGAGIFKRGGVKRYSADTVLKAFVNVALG